MKKIPALLSMIVATSIPFSVSAESVLDAIKSGEGDLNLRYRLETVDQAGLANDAQASTLRAKIGYTTGEYKNISARVELESVLPIGDDTYNNTVNGKSTYPVIADPESTEVNHAYLKYTGLTDTTVVVGRQPLNLDNQRFIGTVGWRQNDQTYDALSLINSSFEDTTIVYAYVNNVNRVFSDKHALGNLETEANVLNVSYTGFDVAKLTGYAYLLNVQDAQTLSSKTFGLRASGKKELSDNAKLLYTAEIATQSDYAGNIANYDATYYFVEPGVSYKGFTAKVGYEVMAGDGVDSFQTPLATGHAFNGWADKFLTTPVNGLEDLYVSVGYKVKHENPWLDKLAVKAVYHDFGAENGGADYGKEWNLLVKKPFAKNYMAMVKYADYDADSFAEDTEKLWLMLQAKF